MRIKSFFCAPAGLAMVTNPTAMTTAATIIHAFFMNFLRLNFAFSDMIEIPPFVF
jgi:hypothetical protein